MHQTVLKLHTLVDSHPRRNSITVVKFKCAKGLKDLEALNKRLTEQRALTLSGSGITLARRQSCIGYLDSVLAQTVCHKLIPCWIQS